MNDVTVKSTIIYSLLFGAFIGLLGVIPILIGYVLLILCLFSSVIVILYMKKNNKYFNLTDTKEGAILGGIVGFSSTIGFYLTFSPMVCILKLIFKSYYAYTIPEAFQMGLWLMFIFIFTVAITFALTNSVTGMGLAWLLGYMNFKPEKKNKLDIKIED